MLTLADTDLLLDLLREADDEPVTLDELGVVGVRDPAAALRALEEAGHAVVRVRDTRAATPVTCVRLAPSTQGAAAVTASGPARPSPVARAHPERPLLLLLAGLLALAVLASRR